MTLEEAQAIIDYMKIPNEQKDYTFFRCIPDEEFIGWMLAERTSLELISGWCYAIDRRRDDNLSLVSRLRGPVCDRIVKDVMELRRLCPESW